ncbi:MAG: helix-turn-helix transcriptional regulator [Myxococcales bacterium]|nr:helix-turn-helix transcriptional regulator [Myxococcales bacterium]
MDEHWQASDQADPYLVLPDGCVDVMQRDGELWVVGPMTTGRLVRAGGRSLQGIRFVPGAARQLLGISPSELCDAQVPLLELTTDRCLLDVAARARRLQPCPLVSRVVHVLLRDPCMPVSRLATQLGLSVRHLRRRFVVEVGLSPKQFARIVRVQRAAARIGSCAQLGDLAFSCGFADQAHLCREVRVLAGVTPTELRRMSDSFKAQTMPLGIC